MLTLMDWGTRHFDDLADTMQLVERKTGRIVRIALVDADTGKPIAEAEHHVVSMRAASQVCDALDDCVVGVSAPTSGSSAQSISRASSK
ncbi:hypothetical protein PO002_08280 [Cupriavidus necator]